MTLPLIYRPTPAGTITDTVVMLDGWQCAVNPADLTDSQATEWWLTTFEGWHGTADLRLAGEDRTQDHGQFDSPSFFGARVITLQGTAICTDRPAAMLSRDIVSSLCWNPAQLYTLRVAEPGRPTRRCQVRLNSAIKVSDVNDFSFDWQVQLKAPDPRKYDDVGSLVTLTPPSGAQGGFTAPFTAPFVSTTTGMSTSQATLTNAGTIATRPIVTLRGPLVDPQIAHVTSGRSLSLGITLATDDVLVLDFDRRTVLLNGSASRSSTLRASAAWWELAPGGNDVALVAGGGSGVAEIRWRSAWI